VSITVKKMLTSTMLMDNASVMMDSINKMTFVLLKVPIVLNMNTMTKD
jgi:hypothetical protein